MGLRARVVAPVQALRRLRWSAIAQGALVGIAALAISAGIGRATDAVDDENIAVVVPLLQLAVVGLAVGGWMAGRRASRAPLVHAVVAAIVAVVVVGVVAAVLSGGVAWGPALTWLLLAVAAGALGGLVALRPRGRAESAG
jgi:hypothetical protein